MGWAGGELNLGQLCRERWGEDCALIGFGTHTGTVAATSDRGGALELKEVRPSREGSLERLCHDAGGRAAAPARQFDAWTWLDETTAVTPLTRASGPADEDSETWPTGL